MARAESLKPPLVLVTRPQGQAEGLLEALRKRACRVAHLPCLEITPLDRDSPEGGHAERLLGDLEGFARGIFISANALQYACSRLHALGGSFPPQLRLYAVGRVTARKAAGLGLEVRHPLQTMDSEGLLALPELRAVRGERIIVLRGLGGRNRLGEELVRRGAAVEHCRLYRRECPARLGSSLRSLLAHEVPELVLISSGQSLSCLVAGDDGRLAARPLVVPARRLALQARELGFGRPVMVAASAEDADMVAAAEEWLRRTG